MVEAWLTLVSAMNTLMKIILASLVILNNHRDKKSDLGPEPLWER
jgi:hypothetical protein